MKNIIWIPYKKFNWKSSLDFNELFHTLKANIQNEKLVNLPSTLDRILFEGHISNNSFTIKRVIPFFYVHSILPIIEGRIRKSRDNTEVNILFRLREGSYVVLGICNLLILFMLIYLLIAAEWESRLFLMTGVLTSMIAFSYFLTIIVFNYEVMAAKEYLIFLLKIKK